MMICVALRLAALVPSVVDGIRAFVLHPGVPLARGAACAQAAEPVARIQIMPQAFLGEVALVERRVRLPVEVTSVTGVVVVAPGGGGGERRKERGEGERTHLARSWIVPFAGPGWLSERRAGIWRGSFD